MLVQQTKATFDAAVAAAALQVGVDLATKAVSAVAVQVQPLTMAGLRHLVWTLGLDVPAADCLILLTNIQAGAAGKGVAWPQT
jgi:hypothetical protein